MSRRHDIENHRRSLDEIRDIMNSMKNLSYIEARRIGSFLDIQHAMVDHIESVAADFLGHYPETLARDTDATGDTNVYLLIGTERGFCGDFNHAILRYFDTTPKTRPADNSRLICVGRKLGSLLEADDREILFIEGASVAEEMDNVLNNLASEMAAIQQQVGNLRLHVIYHANEHEIVQLQLLPPFYNIRQQTAPRGPAPLLNLAAEQFLPELGYQYLVIVLYEILYTSLMAECRQRVSHLDGAVQHLEKQSADLQRQSNSLRQEEIIEEIEVILLNQIS